LRPTCRTPLLPGMQPTFRRPRWVVNLLPGAARVS
jgi:hypothetical protein